jgi:preprotein translocase subunit YajC
MYSLSTLFFQIPLLAEVDGAQAIGGGMNLIVLVLMMAGFWFLLIAPQRKRQKAHNQMLASLVAGDQVLTSGGMYGKIFKIIDDRLIIELAEGVKAEFHKTAVQSKIEGKKAD